MAPTLKYGIGGYLPGAPNGNLIERLDATGYTRWDPAGNVIEQRPLTPAETASLNPPAPPPTDTERIAAAQAALAPLEQIAAPYTAADIVDVLLDVKTALGG